MSERHSTTTTVLPMPKSPTASPATWHQPNCHFCCTCTHKKRLGGKNFSAHKRGTCTHKKRLGGKIFSAGWTRYVVPVHASRPSKRVSIGSDSFGKFFSMKLPKHSLKLKQIRAVQNRFGQPRCVHMHLVVVPTRH